MEIGQKLKNARVNAGFTQEYVAEIIGVSRQAVSGWENDKSYPDIGSVIKLSDLYSISLDELLKDDKKMIAHLQESTDVVKSRKKISKVILISMYLLVCLASIVTFWITESDRTVFYFTVPLISMVFAGIVGKSDWPAKQKWLMIPFFGVMAMLADYVTFEQMRYVVSENNWPNIGTFLYGMYYSAIGMGVGLLIKVVASLLKKIE